MTLILNDESMRGQFDNVPDFLRYLHDELLKVLRDMEQDNDLIYKSEMMFGRMVTGEDNLYSLMTKSGHPEITLLKRYLVQLFSEPFWETDSVYDESTEYYCDEILQTGRNCYTEAIDRQADIWIFKNPDEIFNDQVVGRNSNKEWIIYQTGDYRSFLRVLVRRDQTRLPAVLERHPFVNDFAIRLSDEAQSSLTNISMTDKDIDKLITNIDTMIDDRLNGRKSHYWAPFIPEADEYRLSISDGRELRIYYIWGKTITFLMGYIKKTQETPQSVRKQVGKIAKKYGKD